MSFYVLDIMGSRWKDDTITASNPYRITWENPKSGEVVCNTFIKLVMDAESKLSDSGEIVHLGFHFYKYDEKFDLGLKPSSRPPMVSNVYVPSKTIKNMNIIKMVGYSLNQLEIDKNENIITAVTEEELNSAIEETNKKPDK